MLNLSKKKFDIIIIGAGLSGLILANEISKKSKKNGSIIGKKIIFISLRLKKIKKNSIA